MTLGNRIANLRKKRNMTQEELATHIGVSPQAVSKWEKDINFPDITLLMELGDLFSVSLDYLVKGDSEKVTIQEKVDIDKKILRINAYSHDGDKAKINLPLLLFKLMIETGNTIEVGSMKMKDFHIDAEQLLQIISMGAVGKLVEAESADGDLVEIYVD